jgi:hypothetical protein
LLVNYQVPKKKPKKEAKKKKRRCCSRGCMKKGTERLPAFTKIVLEKLVPFLAKMISLCGAE